MILFHVEHLRGPWGATDEEISPLVARAIEAAVVEAKLADRPLDRMFGEDYELCVVLSDDAHVRELNGEWRGKDRPTNVLSFPSATVSAGETPPGPMLGDIVFAHETCAREAEDQAKSFSDHFTHLFVHGLLHLFGHDHLDDATAEEMEGLERRVLARLGIADPYAQMDAEPNQRADP